MWRYFRNFIESGIKRKVYFGATYFEIHTCMMSLKTSWKMKKIAWISKCITPE